MSDSEGFITFRECPYGCAFCFEGKDSNCRIRSVSNLCKEIEMLLRDRKMTYDAILDDLFTITTQRVYELYDAFLAIQKCARAI